MLWKKEPVTILKVPGSWSKVVDTKVKLVCARNCSDWKDVANCGRLSGAVDRPSGRNTGDLDKF